MTVLFALIPSLVAVAIFVGTFRLTPPRHATQSRSQRSMAAHRASTALRTPLPLGATRRSAVVEQFQA